MKTAVDVVFVEKTCESHENLWLICIIMRCEAYDWIGRGKNEMALCVKRG